MKSVFKFFAERHLLANLLTITILLLGGSSLMRINRSAFPKVDVGRIIITTVYPGASPEDVELNVTNRIEDELKGVTGIDELKSASYENASMIWVYIDDDADLEEVQANIREAVTQVSDLPDEVTDFPRVTEVKASIFPVIEVGMSSEELSYRDLREYARRFEKKLQEIPGVASIDKSGYRAREIQVEVHPDNMMKYNISMGEIINAIEARNIRASGGSLESYTSEKNVVALAQFRDPMEVGDVIIKSSPGGGMVWVKDLAVIHDDFEEERLIPKMNGKKAISFEVLKSEGADIIEVVDAVKALAEKEKSHLPESIEILYSSDASIEVRNSFEVVASNGIVGLFLVLVTLSLFLNVRSSFWVAMGIPVSLLGVIILLPFFDVELDSITLAAMVLVLGIIVDDAIIITESIFQRSEKGETPFDAAVNGAHDVYLPVFTTIATTLLAFLPMFFMKGMMGKFIFVLPLTISLALFVSMVESFIMLPSHVMKGLQSKKGGKQHSAGRTWFGPVRDFFEKLLYTLLHIRYAILLLALLILGGSLFYASNYMDFHLLDTKGAIKIAATIQLPIGTSLQATADKIKEIEAIVQRLPEEELESYLLNIGGSASFITVESSHVATMTLNLTPYSERMSRGGRIADEIVEDLRQQAAAVQGIEQITFSVDVGGPPTGDPIEIKIIGSDDTLRTRLADDVVAFLTDEVEGTKDIDRDDNPGKDEVSINIDYVRLARYGLTVADIAQNVRIAYDGQVVTSTRYGDEDVEFRVIVKREFRQQLGYLKQLRIPNRRGELIALDEVASLDVGKGISKYRHEAGERAVKVTGAVFQDKTTTVNVSNAVLERFEPVLDTEYPGIRLDVGGESQETQDTMTDLMLSFSMAILAIYFLLILLFNSATQPFMVLIAIPFGLCGVIVAFALHGEPLSLLAMTGMIGLGGVVVNDSLVLVDHLNGLQRSFVKGSRAKKKETKDLMKLVASGTADRLRAIVLTTLTTVSGLLPLAYGLGGESVNMAPMGLALGYGLLFATPITLVLIPCLYMIGQDIGNLFRRSSS
ncbi:MAG: efflux RND transporter permease subunit [bacterium]|nr:efflux RND transporter permease subunit [bacterium]